MTDKGKLLFNELEKLGFKAMLTSVEHIAEAKEELEGLEANGMLDARFAEDYLKEFKYDYTEILPDAKYILVVAHLQYIARLSFNHNGKKHSVTMPPTYVYNALNERLEGILENMSDTYNCSFKKAKLPSKLLAVRTGLGRYGRNNISYVEGMGSFHRLYTFYTDLKNGEDNWKAAEVMTECSKCDNCINACPTKCLTKHRFLIHAENCMTYINELEGEFPDWVNKSWHNAIIGCMRCQAACPKNKEFLKNTEAEADFSQEETKLILEGVPFTELPDELQNKLESLNLTEYYEVLNRNLAVLIE